MQELLKIKNKISKAFQKEDLDPDLIADISIESIKSYINVLSNGISPDKIYLKRIQNTWAYEAKQCGILLRDVNFALYKSSATENSEDQRKSQIIKIIKLIEDAQYELINSLQSCIDQGIISEEEKEAWKHYASPGEFVEEQLEKNISQINMIMGARGYIVEIKTVIHSIKEQTEKLIEEYVKDLNSIEHTFITLRDDFFNSGQAYNLDFIKSSIHSLEKGNKVIQELVIDKAHPEFSYKDSKKHKIPMHTDVGNLVFKEIDIKSEIYNWMETQIFPALMDCDRQLELLQERSGSQLLNTKNRLKLLDTTSSDNIISSINTVTSNWNNHIKEIDKAKEEILIIRDNLHTKLALINSQEIFSNKKLFLPEGDSDILSEYSRNTEKWLDFLPFKKATDLFYLLRKKFLATPIVKEGNLADIIEYIKNKNLVDVDKVTYSLFLNKGYIGNSFLIKRERIQNTLQQSIVNWQNGYRGAILLYGKRLSGRSTILETMSYHYPEMDVVNLKPGKEIRFKGRKYTSNFNLEEDLDFLIKHSISQEFIVCIDDLELWRSEEQSIYANIKLLLHNINKYSTKIFFVVATNHWFKYQLDQYFDFSNTFTDIVNTDDMATQDIIRAIKIRHGASMSEDFPNEIENGTSTLNLDKLAKQVALESSNIIGASLKEWAYVYQSGKAMKFKRSKFPSSLYLLLNKKWTIFKHILKYNQTSETEIMKMMGATFLKEVSEDIQFLTSCKIFKRDVNGMLYINEYIVDEIETYLLENRNMLISN